MIDAIISFFSEFAITAFIMVSPSRICRRLIYGIPIKAAPESFFNKAALGIADTMVWAGVLLLVLAILT